MELVILYFLFRLIWHEFYLLHLGLDEQELQKYDCHIFALNLCALIYYALASVIYTCFKFLNYLKMLLNNEIIQLLLRLFS